VHEEIRGKRDTASLKLLKPFWIEEYEKKKRATKWRNHLRRGESRVKVNISIEGKCLYIEDMKNQKWCFGFLLFIR
jgi:hypothetical protein